MKKKILLAVFITVLLMSSICITAASLETAKEEKTELKNTKQMKNSDDPFDLEIKSRLFTVKYKITPTSCCNGNRGYTGTWKLTIDGTEAANKEIPLNCNPDHAYTGGSGAFGFGVGTAKAELKIFSSIDPSGEPLQSLEKKGRWFFGIFFLR